MPRPDDVPDPRAPGAPIRVDDEAEDRARSEITVRELLERELNDPASGVVLLSDGTIAGLPEIELTPADVPNIAPGRLAELRARRDRILEGLRALRTLRDDTEGSDDGRQ